MFLLCLNQQPLSNSLIIEIEIMTTPRYEVTPRFRLEIASAQTDAVKKGGASGTLLTFLEKLDGQIEYLISGIVE